MGCNVIGFYGNFFIFVIFFSNFSSPEPKVHKVSLLDATRAVCANVSTLSNMNISETSGPIAIKFYLKHHGDGGKAALGFGPDQIRTLVSMAAGSSHWVIMGKIL